MRAEDTTEDEKRAQTAITDKDEALRTYGIANEGHGQHRETTEPDNALNAQDTGKDEHEQNRDCR